MPSKTAVITRRGVLEALKKEPLAIGSIFHDEGKPGCKVCAVGAVLRRFSFERFIRSRVGAYRLNQVAMRLFSGDLVAMRYANIEIERYLDHKEYLPALSVYFEQGRTRAQCLRFVRKNFPVRFEFKASINVALP